MFRIAGVGSEPLFVCHVATCIIVLPHSKTFGPASQSNTPGFSWRLPLLGIGFQVGLSFQAEECNVQSMKELTEGA